MKITLKMTIVNYNMQNKKKFEYCISYKQSSAYTVLYDLYNISRGLPVNGWVQFDLSELNTRVKKSSTYFERYHTAIDKIDTGASQLSAKCQKRLCLVPMEKYQILLQKLYKPQCVKS